MNIFQLLVPVFSTKYQEKKTEQHSSQVKSSDHHSKKQLYVKYLLNNSSDNLKL